MGVAGEEGDAGAGFGALEVEEGVDHEREGLAVAGEFEAFDGGAVAGGGGGVWGCEGAEDLVGEAHDGGGGAITNVEGGDADVGEAEEVEEAGPVLEVVVFGDLLGGVACESDGSGALGAA